MEQRQVRDASLRAILAQRHSTSTIAVAQTGLASLSQTSRGLYVSVKAHVPDAQLV